MFQNKFKKKLSLCGILCQRLFLKVTDESYMKLSCQMSILRTEVIFLIKNLKSRIRMKHGMFLVYINKYTFSEYEKYCKIQLILWES